MKLLFYETYVMKLDINTASLFVLLTHPCMITLDRNSVDKYSSEAAKLVSCLLKFLAVDMGVEPESFQAIFRGQPQRMRMTYYPPCKQANKVVGLSPHTDRMGLTLLLQANDVQGLQIRKDGKWLAINVLDGAFIVNVGDALEVSIYTIQCT